MHRPDGHFVLTNIKESMKIPYENHINVVEGRKHELTFTEVPSGKQS